MARFSSTSLTFVFACIVCVQCLVSAATVGTYQAANCIQGLQNSYDGAGDGVCAINPYAGFTFSGELVCKSFTSASAWELKAFSDQACTQVNFDVSGVGNGSCVQATSTAIITTTVYNQVDCGRYFTSSFYKFEWAVNSSISSSAAASAYSCNPATCCCFTDPVWFNATAPLGLLNVTIGTTGTCGQALITFQTALFGEIPETVSLPQLNNYNVTLNRWGDSIIIHGTDNPATCQTQIRNVNPAKYYYPVATTAAPSTSAAHALRSATLPRALLAAVAMLSALMLK